MNVKELKEILLELPDDAEVVIPGSDHSYQQPDGLVVEAVWYQRDRQWCEDFDFESDPKSKCSRHKVLLIS